MTDKFINIIAIYCVVLKNLRSTIYKKLSLCLLLYVWHCNHSSNIFILTVANIAKVLIINVTQIARVTKPTVENICNGLEITVCDSYYICDDLPLVNRRKITVNGKPQQLNIDTGFSVGIVNSRKNRHKS